MVALRKAKFILNTYTKFQVSYTISKIYFVNLSFQLDNIHHQGGEGYPPVARLPAQPMG